MLITDVTVEGNASSLGYSVFAPGSVVGPVNHSVEEVAYVVAGSGELQLDDGPYPFEAGQAVHIPAGVWHSVANTGDRRRRDGLRLPVARLSADRASRGLMAATAQSLREQVAWACRILALEGYADLTLGHVSGRPEGDDIVQIKRKGVALDEVDADDVIELDLSHDEVPLTPEMHLEAVLHTEVYKARPDVGAVVHGHPPFVTAFAATGATLEMLTHDSVLFAEGLAVFEETPEMITEVAEGKAVAAGARRQARRDPAQPRGARRRQERALGRADGAHAGARRPAAEHRARARHAAPDRARARAPDGRGQVPGSLRRRVLGRLDPASRAARRGTVRPRRMRLELTVNGARVVREIAPEELLLDFIRDTLHLKGTKASCEVQVCGACTVLVDGEPVSACCFLAADAEGRDVLTIEGLREQERFVPLEQAFTRHAAVQCGFCTPGMLLTIASLQSSGELGDEAAIRHGLEGNLCRCTGYRGILEAVREIAGVEE